ncbi:MAG TPA: undecaprenyl-diphosphate phosphatase [Solirubrobacteraceae bacterium]
MTLRPRTHVWPTIRTKESTAAAARRVLKLRHAVALGLAQGPTELLPVSSSAHTTLIPFLAGWPYAELDPELRKSFEVALHAGAGLALAIDMRRELIAEASGLDRRRVTVIALSLAPPAIAGFALEGPIERRLGGPRSIVAGLFAGGVAMAVADGRAGGWARTGTRRRKDARARDGLALGLAQTMALIPGVSRSGATLTAARARGFGRSDAQALSWHAALPVILGASALKGHRLTRRGAPAGAARTLAAGGGAAFVSTLASARLLRRGRLAERSLLPYALYRCLLAAFVARRLREGHNRDG